MKYIILVVLISLYSCKSDEAVQTSSGPEITDTDGDMAFPLLQWPIDHSLHDQVYISNYVDLDATAGTRDYSCDGQHTYDGHTGLDIALLNFRLMDKGIGVVAAADGEVTWTEDFNFDRNYWTPYQGSHNGVVVTYPDGAFTAYAHMRKNSVAVKVGEKVKAGDFLGFVGSSGTTPIPHLHFANRSKDNAVIDPFSGSCRAGESFWIEQPPYIAHKLSIYDADIYTDFDLTGGYQFGEIRTFKDRPFAPAVYGVDQPKLGLWVQLQGIAGQKFIVEVKKPDGTIFISEEKFVETKRRYGWYGYNWDFSEISEDDFGTWSYSIINGENELNSDFEVEAVTEYGPRFYPLAGKSIKIGESSSSDDLILHESSPEVTFELINAPSGVTISGNTVTFGSSLSTRNHHFQVKATDAKGRSDLMYYHLIDLSQPL